MKIEIKENNACVVTVAGETYEGRVEEGRIILENFFMGGGLMMFLGENSRNWKIGETVYNSAVMGRSSIVEGRMLVPTLVFSNEG